MKKPERPPLMIAYMIFIAVCIIVYALSQVINFQFTLWNNIVTAVTIASFFFSGASISNTTKSLLKYLIEKNEELLEYAWKSDSLIEKYMKENNMGRPPENKLFSDNIENIIEFNKKKLTKSKTEYFILTTIGFLSFFCILTFEPLYFYFLKSQDLYSMLAFLMVLYADYKVEYNMAKFEIKINEIKDDLMLRISIMEDNENE